MIVFTKTAYDIQDKKCAAQENADYTIVKGGCAPIAEAEYRSTLDGIIGTFVMKAGQ